MFGRVLLTLDSVMLLFGAFLADYNHTHIFNPRWPPHAKFHDAQCILLSILLGLATLFLTWRPDLSGTWPFPRPVPTTAAATTTTTKAGRPEPLPTAIPAGATAELRTFSLRAAAFTGSIYWLAALGAIAFPGTSGLDPEFGGPGFPQMVPFTACAAAAMLAPLLEEEG